MKKQLVVALGAAALFTASIVPAYAATNDKDSNDFYSNILIQIDNDIRAVGHTVDSIAQMIIQAPKDMGNDIAAWQGMNMLSQKQSQLTKSSADTIDQSFAGQDTMAKTVDQAFNIDTRGAGNYSGLSAYSLLGTTVTNYNNQNYYTKTYNSDQAKAANDYMQFLSGAAMPVQMPDPDSIDDKQTINLLRTMQAVQSLNAYNVSKIYASRMPLASTASLKLSGVGTPNGQISQQGLLKYLMQKNINSPEWRQQIVSDSPFTVIRQGTLLLGAAVSELYRIEQNQEQMILTQTATNTATVAMAKTLLMQMQQAKDISARAQQQ